MSDTNVNYMNAYVDLTMETVHSYLNEILQLKTQLKLLNGLVLDKDQVISSLQQQVDTLSDERGNREQIEAELQKVRDESNGEIQKLRENAATWEFQFNSMKEKVSHMDTLINQHNDLQKEFVIKTNELEHVSTVLAELKPKLDESNRQVENLTAELASANKKIDRLTKKEEKKVSVVTPVTPSKKDINKDETKSTSLSQKIVDKPKETDDDF
jgi:chromosome segregation ATPase